MSLPRYAEYKASGMQWLGDVPQHWQLRRLGYYFDERREKVSDVHYPPLSVTKNGIVPQLETAAKTDDNDNRKKVCNGDFVINSRSDRKGSSGLSKLEGSVSLINTVLSPRDGVASGFVHHLFRSEAFQEEFYRFGQGIVADLWSTNYSEMRNILLAVPPLAEQAAIASFLDRELNKIDTLVSEQEQLIELLKEKRQAVISHAVTKGLNPHVPMKPSGIEWLGDVPAHWVVTKCGRFLSILSGFAFPSSGFRHDGNGIPLLRGINVGVGTLRWEDVVYWGREPTDGLDEYEVRLGDVVIGMDRPLIAGGVRIAKAKQEDLPCLLLQRVAVIRTTGRLCSDFIAQFLSIPAYFASHFSPDTTGVSVPHISPEQISSFVICVPPIEEQQAIVTYLKTRATEFDGLQAEAERTIELLKERRSALISAAVTGQIDVRRLAA